METTVKHLTRFDYQNHFEKGLTSEQYRYNFETELQNKEQNAYSQYLPINWQRIKRIEKTFVPSQELIQALAQLSDATNWLVISEHWCGDAAQILPVLDAIVSASAGKVKLRIVYRDENPNLMNAHLTGTSKSIPKLIQLDKNFVMTGQWGPRPNEAQEMVLKLKANPATADTYSEQLHKWYARDKQQDIQKELSQLLHKAAAHCADCLL